MKLKFKPMMILRYSAALRTTHNKIHRLDALDAYNQKLVKKIAVFGIAVKGLAGQARDVAHWAISCKEGSVKHIYFVAETKGFMSSMELRAIEHTKIECARKFFTEINCKIDPEHLKYDVVTSFGKLMKIVGAGTVSPCGGDC